MKTDYDMVVVGGGAAGLTAAGMSAVLGAKTLLVSDAPLGGDCTWHGCIPSKSLLKAAKVAHEIKNASAYGLTSADPVHDWSRVIGCVHGIRDRIYRDADAPPNMEKLGVEVLAGRAKFINRNSIEVSSTATTEKRIFSSRYFVVAAGSRPSIPNFPGSDRIRMLTNESLFELEQRPQRLLVLGAGPVGIEMAQAFHRLGSAVTVVNRSPRILRHDDAELAGMLVSRLRDEGINFELGNEIEDLGETSAQLKSGKRIEFDAILSAVGREPNIRQLNLDAAGVQTMEKGVTVDGHGRTNVKHIYACGDVTGKHLFTHMAEHTAKVAVMNAILHVPSSIDERRVPWCTFTDPELAHVGAGEEELRKKGEKFRVYRFPLGKLDRAITEAETTGLVKVFANARGKVFGASILGAHAGEMISEYALAMKAKAGLSTISATIHPYPTYSLGNRRAADLFTTRLLTPSRVNWVRRIFGLRGGTAGVVAINEEDRDA